MNPFRCGPNPCRWPCKEVTLPGIECPQCSNSGYTTPATVLVTLPIIASGSCSDCSAISQLSINLPQHPTLDCVWSSTDDYILGDCGTESITIEASLPVQWVVTLEYNRTGGVLQWSTAGTCAPGPHNVPFNVDTPGANLCQFFGLGDAIVEVPTP